MGKLGARSDTHMPGLTLVLLLRPGPPPPPPPGLPRRSPSHSRGRGPAPTFGRAVPREVTRADAQSLPLSSNHLKSADRAVLSGRFCKCFISTEGCGAGLGSSPGPRPQGGAPRARPLLPPGLLAGSLDLHFTAHASPHGWGPHRLLSAGKEPESTRPSGALPPSPHLDKGT